MTEFSTVDHYEIVRTLGKGASAKVRLGKDINTGEHFALKIMKKTASQTMSDRFMDMVQNEIAALNRISHSNIVNIAATNENATYVKKNGAGSYQCMYIAMECCPNGELFDILFQTGAFPENLARFYFKQIISGLEACHNEGLCHRDMKPENLLFDADYNLKIADFGFSIVLSGRDGSGMLHTHLGTENYMAPEIHARKAYNGVSVDLFALGIILFIMMSKNPPFAQPRADDQFYKMLYTGHERFWQLHSRNKPAGFYSPEFRSLLTSMLALDPTQRLSIAEIKAHPWYNQESMSAEEACGELARRKQRLEEAAERARQAKLARAAQGAPNRFGVQTGGRVFKAGLEESLGLSITAENYRPKTLRPYKASANKFTEFYSSYSADELLIILADYFDNMEDVEKELKFDEGQYKFSFNFLKEVDEVDFTVKVMGVNEDVRAVSISQNKGQKFEFLEMYEKMHEELPDLADALLPAN